MSTPYVNSIPREQEPWFPGDEHIERELRAQFAAHRGNVTQVARAMGKARVQVQRWMKRFI